MTQPILRLSHIPEIRMFRQDTLDFVVTVAVRAFTGHDMLRIDEPTMLRVIAEVQGEIRALDGKDALPRKPADYLGRWLGHYAMPGEAEPITWFGTETQGTDKFITLLPAARSVIEFVTGLSASTRAATSSSLGDLVDLILDSASRIEGNSDTRLAALEARRRKLDREIEAVRAEGLKPMVDNEREELVRDLSGRMSQLTAGFSAIPSELRAHNLENEEIYANGTGAKSEVLEQVLDRNDEKRRGPIYRILHSLRELYLDDARKEQLDQSLKAIEAACSAHLDPAEAHRMARFLPDLASISQRILEEDAAASQSQEAFIRSSGFTGRRAAMSVLKDIQENLQRIRDELKPGIRDARLEGVGIQIVEPLSAGPGCDLMLANRMPEPEVEIEIVDAIDESEIDEKFERLRNERAVAQGRHLNPSAVRERILGSFHGRQRIKLSELLASTPLQYGVEELVAYLGATGRMAVEIDPDIKSRIPLGNGWDAICSDPVFLPEEPASAETSPSQPQRDAS